MCKIHYSFQIKTVSQISRRKLLKYDEDSLPKSILTYQIYVIIAPLTKQNLSLQLNRQCYMIEKRLINTKTYIEEVTKLQVYFKNL